MFGIEAIEIYFPNTYVDQAEYQTYKGAGTGKYTKGLGQLQLSFANINEDINSMSLTVNNLLKNNNIHPSRVGRLEVGTETLLDRSKSTKTVLMTLFQGHHDIEGATTINACYGATNALINTLNWVASPYWDGRYGIVVAADLAVYEDGPARCTGGAGAVALLIGPNGKITFDKERASFMDHAYDFYKPNPSSEYPVVDGKVSIDCYLRALEECYQKLKSKRKNRNILDETDFLCFHSPFTKMVQKAFSKMGKLQGDLSQSQIASQFLKKVSPTLTIPQRIGNIYTGSVYSCLVSLLTSGQQVTGKKVLLFSYGSGLCATMLSMHVHSNPLLQGQREHILGKLDARVKVSPQEYTSIMLEREKRYLGFVGQIRVDQRFYTDDVYYLKEIDEKWRRTYHLNNQSAVKIEKQSVSAMIRLQQLNKKLTETQQFTKFYKLPVNDRLELISCKTKKQLDKNLIQNGGLTMELADTMIENVIGKLSLPLGVVPQMVINNKSYVIPMCVEQPSVVAACSSIGKFLSPYSFFTSSTPSIMIGQVHLPNSETNEIHKILSAKSCLISQLNKSCKSMVSRGGGVKDIRIRELDGPYTKQYSVDILIDVCEAMGANITNTLCEKAKDHISKMGIKVGIAIMTNYCVERKAVSSFEIPVSQMGWKGVSGLDVAQKILEAYSFAKNDRYRAATHNKGIMNGIDSVCLATGQDWRAVESSAHVYASRSNVYMPLTHYSIFEKDGEQHFRGILELPISVGTKGGVLEKNPIYRQTMEILGNPSAKQLSQILVTVGLAQNFAALRALAIEGINKGHMVLHARTIAQKSGVPKQLIDEACKFMALRKKYDEPTAQEFLQAYMKSKL